MADIFDVVADPTRRELLNRLLELGDGEASVSTLVQETGASQPTVSKHLKTLREAGLVVVREEGQHRYYRLDREPLEQVRSWLAAFAPAEPLPSADSPESAGFERANPADSGESGVDARLGAGGEWVGVEVGERIGRAAAQAVNGVRLLLPDRHSR